MQKILIIDDSNLSRTKLKELLSERYDLTFAKNGKEGLQKLEEENFSLVILDLLMPEVSGQDVLSKMKENEINTPTIVYTADIQDTTKNKCIELGATAFLNKPINKESLFETLKNLFNLSTGQHEY